jgi:hypothetical protein
VASADATCTAVRGRHWLLLSAVCYGLLRRLETLKFSDIKPLAVVAAAYIPNRILQLRFPRIVFNNLNIVSTPFTNSVPAK